MTQIDFYILQQPDHLLYSCRLVAKALQQKYTIHLHTASAQQAQQLNRLLWQFQDVSFIPHACEGEPMPVGMVPVTIGCSEQLIADQQLLVNVDTITTPPLFFSRFARLAEIVPDNQEAKQNARQRFRFYKDRGYPIEVHQ